MPDISYRDALRAAQDGDVDPLDATRLPGWGWPEHERGLPPPDDWHGERVIVWSLASLTLWVIGLTALFWAIKAGWFWR
jgi:hypothetical protein